MRRYGNWLDTHLKVGDKVTFYKIDEWVRKAGNSELFGVNFSDYAMYECAPAIMNSGAEYTVTKISDGPGLRYIKIDAPFDFNYSPDTIKLINGRQPDEA